MKQEIVKAWHFVGNTLRDGSPVPPDGKWLKIEGPVILCKRGLHWSRDPFDALQYAPGPVLCEVEARGGVVEQNDKGASLERRIVRRMDFTEMLRYFARMQALSVIHLYPNGTDGAVFDYLMTGENADAAESAAWAARLVESAAWAAARSAAESAARSARSAESTQREYFNHLVNECFR